ncbi:TIGR02281 family clan AA aspartic protease [Mesobaculum littorinae]|uniref:TIGR02281 family clan AA aspartic protease n=1 Tax=Mesobaculum littorinae TaxID=2486419 RepID=A0A438AJI4_9RHOB|nr:TIGR02281 family clan AA aspartic protease [Mesobaculum littorinae]RVV98943.1 TIGR02281 family clan AA aspartic protease [Mesobaculum littorinae]
MTGDDYGRIAYLVLLLLVLGGYFVVASRDRMGKTLQQAAIWGLIFVGVVAVAGLWSDIRDTVAPRQSYVGEAGRIVEVPRAPDGHYYLTLGINDAAVDFVIDTGASDMVLTRRDAERAGIDPDELAYLGRAQTANGVVPIAQVMLDRVTLGPLSDANVTASVNGGEMGMSLLGMSYLQRFGRIEIAENRLVLER